MASPRISMDLPVSPQSSWNAGIWKARRSAIVEGCVDVLERLSTLAAAIEAFRVTFNEKYPNEMRIEVFYSDPFGTKRSHATSYRFKIEEPSSSDIANNIWANGALPTNVHAHVKASQTKLAAAQRLLDAFNC